MHVPAPHPPYFYDRKTGRMDARSSSPERYYDQLALVDRSLGELRAAMKREGVWDTTAVILSSDHWLRGTPLKGKKMDYRVPFLVKLPGERHGTVLNEAFNTVVTKNLIAAIRRNSVGDAAAWLREHRGTIAESPYYAN
jgi:arylsulfatase A-like enzyme